MLRPSPAEHPCGGSGPEFGRGWFDSVVIDWAAIRDVYGPATEVPDLLRRAEASGDASELWNELWGRLCHQGTVSPASYAALPLLLGIAERHPGSRYLAALHLAGAIVASTDGPRDNATVRRENVSTIERLRAVALRNLDEAESDADFVYGLEALLAFEDRGPWQRTLNHIADQELPFDCPLCGEFLLLSLEGPRPRLASYADGSCKPTDVTPVEPEPGSNEHRALELALACGRDEVADQMRHIFGKAICPCCRHEFGIPSAVE
jgi:hypothetical protein